MDDWTVLVKNAVAVLVILMAIAVVSFLAYLGLNAANRGGEQMAETVASFDARTYETYDQTTVSGTTALAAVKNFRNRSVAILVRTAGASTTITNYCAILHSADPGAAIAAGVIAKTGITFSASAPSNTSFQWLSGTATNHDVSGLVTSLQLWPLSQNTAITSATNKSATTYINPTAKFRSVIIYNANKEPVGIYLEQVGTTNAGL